MGEKKRKPSGIQRNRKPMLSSSVAAKPKFSLKFPGSTKLVQSSMVVTKSRGLLARECSWACGKSVTSVQLYNINNNGCPYLPRAENINEINRRFKRPFDICNGLNFMGFCIGYVDHKDNPAYHYSSFSAYLTDHISKIILTGIAFAPHVYSNTSNRSKDVVLTRISSPAFLVSESYNYGDGHKWKQLSCNLVDHNDPGKGYMRFCTGVWLKDKFYALSLQGTLVVIEDLDTPRPLITDVGSGRAVPSGPWRHFREHLLEFKGEILLILLVSKKLVGRVDYLEVYGLNVSKLSWVKKERMEDMRLFLGVDLSVTVNNTSEVECKKNSCIYFTSMEIDGWKVYDMETGCIREAEKESFMVI